MGEHITEDGKFLSDKYRIIRIADGKDVTPDKLVLSFNDRAALSALSAYAWNTKDEELRDDLFTRLRGIPAGDG